MLWGFLGPGTLLRRALQLLSRHSLARSPLFMSEGRGHAMGTRAHAHGRMRRRTQGACVHIRAHAHRAALTNPRPAGQQVAGLSRRLSGKTMRQRFYTVRQHFLVGLSSGLPWRSYLVLPAQFILKTRCCRRCHPKSDFPGAPSPHPPPRSISNVPEAKTRWTERDVRDRWGWEALL